MNWSYAIRHISYEIWRMAYLACQRVEGESGSDQWVVFFNEVVRVPEASVASLWRKLDRQIRQDTRDRMRVIEAQSRFPGSVTSFVETWRPVGPVMIPEPFERFRDAWILVGNAGGPQGQNAIRCRSAVARKSALAALTGLVDFRIDRREVKPSIRIL